MKKNKSPLFIIFFTIFLDLLGFGIILPAMPYFANAYEAGGFKFGLLGSIYSGMQFLFNPVWGRLSDRYGRRPIIIMSLTGSAASHFLFALSENLTGLFIARGLAGVFGANIAASQAYMADVTTNEDRSKAMGIIGAAFGIGMIVGPILGVAFGALGGRFGGGTGVWGSFHHMSYQLPAMAASFLCFANMVFACFRLPESKSKSSKTYSELRGFTISQVTTALRHPGLHLMLFLFFSATFGLACMEYTLPFLLKEKFNYGLMEFGILLAAAGFLMALIQGMALGRLSKKFGDKKLIGFGYVLMGAGLMTIPAGKTVLPALVGMACLGTGYGLSNPSLSSAMSKSIDASIYGGILGISQALSSLARVVGPAWGGYALEYLGTGMPYHSSGALIAAGFLLILVLFPKLLKDVGDAPRTAH